MECPTRAQQPAQGPLYNVTTRDILAGRRQCLGANAFLWGSKQEATATWCGMLLPTGEKTIAVDALTEAWTGRWPANRAPILGATDVPVVGRRVAAATRIRGSAAYRDPDGDPRAYAWEVREESTDRGIGGDVESVPRRIDGCVLETGSDGSATVVVPEESGA